MISVAHFIEKKLLKTVKSFKRLYVEKQGKKYCLACGEMHEEVDNLIVDDDDGVALDMGRPQRRDQTTMRLNKILIQALRMTIKTTKHESDT